MTSSSCRRCRLAGQGFTDFEAGGVLVGVGLESGDSAGFFGGGYVFGSAILYARLATSLHRRLTPSLHQRCGNFSLSAAIFFSGPASVFLASDDFGVESVGFMRLVVSFCSEGFERLRRPRISVPLQTLRRWVAGGKEFRGAARDAGSTLVSLPLTSGGLSDPAGLCRFRFSLQDPSLLRSTLH